MGNVAPGGMFSGGGDPFVDATMKAAIARTNTPLAIVGAKPIGKNQFGDDETSFTVRVSAKAAKLGALEAGDYKLALPHTEVRENQAQAVLEAIAGGATSIGPVYLAQVRFKSGKLGWQLGEEPGDGEVDESGNDNAGAKPAADDTDDFPF